MAFLESVVQKQLGGRQPGDPQSAGMPSPQPSAPQAPNPPAPASAPGGRPPIAAGPSPAPSPFGPGGVGGAGPTPSSPSPGLPPAPPVRSAPAAPPAAPPTPTAAPGAPAAAPAGQPAAPTPQPVMTQLDRAPTAADFAAQPVGVQFATPYGSATRGADGKISYQFSPEGEAKYRQAVAAKVQRFGPLPALIQGIPNLPQPPVSLESPSFNPFTGAWIS